MFKSLVFFSLLAAVSGANAQTADQVAVPTQPAPIVHSYPASFPSNHSALRQPRRFEDQIVESQPIAGVWLRSEQSSAVKTITATPQRTEIRLDRGRLNVNVHDPAEHAEILVDLPGGQVDLFKNGLYTFNADTNTIRVLKGEAAAYPGPITVGTDSKSTSKPFKIKEDHQLSLVAAATGTKSGEVKSVEAYPYELTADLLPFNHSDGYGDGYADYGDGYAPYPYPYYAGAWGYPYGYYGYGYPFGIGFGYYGGFGGGYYGGFRGGFRR